MNNELEKYPYFICPAIMALRENRVPGGEAPLSEEQATWLRRLIAANVGDIPSLRTILGIDPEEFERFYPDMLPPTLSTADTIDSFLSHFGDTNAPTPKAAAEIPEATREVPITEGPVYRIENAEELAGSQPSEDATSSAIDSFLARTPAPRKPMTQNAKKPSPATVKEGEKRVVSEANARILIKKHDYQGALEIIQQLILNNPEKSVYFADQIRFLRKLILIQAQKNN